MNIINDTDLLRDYESAKLVRYDDYDPNSENTYAFDELGEKSVGGLPLVSVRANGRLYITFTPDTHVLVLGSTRSGKTTGYILPTIFIKAHQKRKDSMLITDPKGELYAKSAEMLGRQGYKVVLVNFRDYRHSEFWNPLTQIFRKYRRASECAKRVRVVKVSDKEYIYEFDGRSYPTKAALNLAMERAKKELIADISLEIEALALNLVPTMNTRDPYWEDSARQLFTAFIWAMLEDSDFSENNPKRITEDTFSFRTVLDTLATFRTAGGDCDNGYFSKRAHSSRAYVLAKEPILHNAPNTRQCIISSLNAKLMFMRPAVSKAITCTNTFDMKELFSSELTLPKPFYFILDEFGNLPQIPDFENTISACGSRNIWFVLVIQSYAQLDRVYGNDVSAIIADNMNMRMFIGSNNAQTKKKFSDECGVRTIVSPFSALNGSGVKMERYEKDIVPVVPVSRLGTLEPGECIVTRSGAGEVLWSKIERHYLCPEFVSGKVRISDYTTNVYPFDDKYVYRISASDCD